MTIDAIRKALEPIPEHLRDELLDHFVEAQKAASARDWEKVGLRSGKFCETAYCVLSGHCTGIFPAQVAKPKDMQSACRGLESENSRGASRSARVQIPRVVAAVYELRNNRSIGHAGGDVRPNQMDGLFFDQSLKWMVCEFIRLFSPMPVDQAAHLVDQVSVRWTPAVWENGGTKRALLDGASIEDKILALLHFSDGTATVADLRIWVQAKNITHLKDRQISRLDQANMVHFDQKTGLIHILPAGTKRVEDELLPRLK